MWMSSFFEDDPAPPQNTSFSELEAFEPQIHHTPSEIGFQQKLPLNDPLDRR